ncbi:MAG: hypothetical protein MUO62_17855 [Anaerolineales bacterium]|nr:hypothetical protein [Anaerolineales bacterium]
MSAWLKAGLIGAAILIVLNLIGLVSFLVCLTAPLTLVAYIVVGVLAASYLPPKREAGPAAGQGALAAVVASLGGGIVNMIISLVRAGRGTAFQGVEIFSQLPPEVRHQFQDIGISPDLLAGLGGIGGAVVCGSVCCLAGILFAAALGAVGAAIYASVKPD